MKKKIIITVLFALIAGLSANTAYAKIKLTFNNYFPPTHVASQLSESFCKEIEKRTNGEVVITHYAGGQLLKAPEVYEGVVLGIADIGFSNLAYTRGMFPEMEMCDLPLGMPSAWVATHVVNRFYQKYKPKEFSKAKMLFFAGCGPNLVSTTQKPIKTLEDLKGQTVRATGRIADTAQALGATSRSIPIVDTYESVNKNVISGVMLPLETMITFRLGEVLKYCTADWQVGNIYTFYTVMNQKKWNKLPDNIKKIFEEVSAEWVEKSAQGWNNIDLAGLDYFKNKGGQMILLDDSETSRWNAAVEPVIKQYIAEMSEKGLSSVKDLEDRINFIRQTRDEMLKEQAVKNIPMLFTE